MGWRVSVEVKIKEDHPALRWNNGRTAWSPLFKDWFENNLIGMVDMTPPMKHFESSEFRHDYLIVIVKFRTRMQAIQFLLAPEWKDYRSRL